VVLGGVAAFALGIMQIAAQWRHPLLEQVKIDLSLRALPKYALFSFARGWIAYFFSLLFTLVVASWAFYDAAARRYIVPALDVLQSMPVTTFLPSLELAMVSIFHRSNTGLELACIFAIFLGQVWNMTFSYYDSLRGTPADFRMLGTLYNFNWWHRFWRIELPFGAQGLLYNSMVSMAGGWFFLNVCETFSSGGKDFRVPGIGSYMQLATDQGNVRAQVCGVVAMGAVIIVTDRLIWTPLIVWSRRFKQDDFGGSRSPQSRLQVWLARSATWQRILSIVPKLQHTLLRPVTPPSAETSLLAPGSTPPRPSRTSKIVYGAILAVLVVLLGWGALRLVWLLAQVHLRDWGEIFRDTAITFVRVMAALAIGTLWTVPCGIWIGLNPKLSGRLQPFIQFVASFPAPMLYPWLLGVIFFLHGTLQTGSVLLILFGTQWYILFNVAGATAAIPNDMICCADILRLKGWGRWAKFLIPAILPGLVTGWLTGAGGAWNATIVAEYVASGSHVFQATGLGSYITRAGNASDFPRLAAAGLVMAGVVVLINRLVWKRLQTLANDRCRFIT
jgi:NitT/TauT family transport system permease protein